MIVCLILGIIITIFYIILTILGFVENFEVGITMLLLGGFLYAISIVLFIMPFLALDRANGSSIGVITAVDKNFFGTSKLYIKTSENNEDTYCMENQDIIEQAKELLGKKVKIYYGERVGLYNLDKCRSAPIERIEMSE